MPLSVSLPKILRAASAPGCLLLVLLPVLTGCNRPWRDAYFDKGLHRLSQAEIQEKLGPPHTNKTSLLGEQSVWTYRYAMSEEEMDPWGKFGNTASKAKDSAAALVGQNSDAGKYPTLRCMKYTLKFDKEKLLEHWKRDPCGLPNRAATP